MMRDMWLLVTVTNLDAGSYRNIDVAMVCKIPNAYRRLLCSEWIFVNTIFLENPCIGVDNVIICKQDLRADLEDKQGSIIAIPWIEKRTLLLFCCMNMNGKQLKCNNAW
jgi:hypothetical protein